VTRVFSLFCLPYYLNDMLLLQCNGSIVCQLNGNFKKTETFPDCFTFCGLLHQQSELFRVHVQYEDMRYCFMYYWVSHFRLFLFVRGKERGNWEKPQWSGNQRKFARKCFQLTREREMSTRQCSLYYMEILSRELKMYWRWWHGILECCLWERKREVHKSEINLFTW